MSALFATPSALLGWLKAVAASHTLTAPRMQGASVLFRTWSADGIAALDSPAELLLRGTMSPKQVMFPKAEVLVKFTATKDEEDPSKLHQEVEAPLACGPAVLFGARPCDARGFVTLDRPFMEGPFKDPYYTAHRTATVVVTQACSNALSTCFCNWVDSNPADEAGSDILFTPVEGGFLFKAVTEKGEGLLASAAFAAASEEQIAAAAQVQEEAAAALPAPSELSDIPAKMAARFKDEAFWDKETVKCLSCGACTYICPTCQCFTITDEGTALKGKRMRSWDTCMSPLFTMEASGYNPRAQKFKRMRNRISHKFSYYPENYGGAYSCVGCGRCVRSCPVNLDIRAIVKHAVDGVVLEAKPEPAKVKPASAPISAPAQAPMSQSQPKAAPAAKAAVDSADQSAKVVAPAPSAKPAATQINDKKPAAKGKKR